MSAPRSSLALAFPLLAPALLPDEAEACPYPYDCEDVPSWSNLAMRNAAKIPTDGAIVFEGLRRGEGDPLANLTIEVTRDGQPIAGAFETTPNRNVLVWRPADPWEPGATYTVEGTASNPGVTPYCGSEEEVFGGEVLIDTEPSGELGVPAFTNELQKPQDRPHLALEELACCVGGAAPGLTSDYCGGYYLDWDPDVCGPTKATGFFALTIFSAPVAEGPFATSVLYNVKVDGEVVQSSFDPASYGFYDLTAPVCVTLEALDLGTMKSTASEEQCFGEMFVAQLGPKELVPDILCPLEQCAVVDGMWDKTMCTPYGPEPETTSDSDTPTSSDTDPETGGSGGSGSDTDPEQEGDKGCACSSEPDAPPAALLLAAPLLLTRRRRA